MIGCRKGLLFALAVVIGIAYAPGHAEGGGFGKIISRGFGGGVKKNIGRAPYGSRTWERYRDRATPSKPLSRPGTFFRYTTKEQANKEMRKGVLPGRHMTAPGGPGRPMTPHNAKRRYGLPRPPQVRETIHLEKGFPARNNKVIKGTPGTVETTSPRHIPQQSIVNVVPLLKDR